MIPTLILMAFTTLNAILILILQAGKIQRLEAELYLLRTSTKKNTLRVEKIGEGVIKS